LFEEGKVTGVRNYSLTGPSTREAFEAGLVAAAWYKTPIDRKKMKALMQRKDSPAMRDTLILFSVMSVCVVAAIQLWPSWWSLPFDYRSGEALRTPVCEALATYPVRVENDRILIAID
jgi:hypothetical protein